MFCCRRVALQDASTCWRCLQLCTHINCVLVDVVHVMCSYEIILGKYMCGTMVHVK
jgi:hypothetical protein